ncbi:hypothetical protein [Embleya sp. NPDC020886]|uniref:hypothetical protein n=1 Tax=Embleya sp. NPDC020886 TaxID=3363980 RepID=UPI0037908D83
MTERDARDESMEDLLRAALASRADSVTLGSLRPPGPPGSVREHRSRRHTIGIPLAILAIVAAAFGGVSLVGAPDTKTSAPMQSRVPSPLPTQSVRPTPTTTVATPERTTTAPGAQSPEAPESDTPETGRATHTRASSRPPSTPPTSEPPGFLTRPRSPDVSAIKFARQPSWTVVREDAAHQCVLANAKYAGDCLGHGAWINVQPVPDPSGLWPSDPFVDTDAGALTQPLCLRDGMVVTPPPTGAVSVLDTKSTVTVAGYPAKYRSWTVTCAGIGSYQVRLWWLVEQGVYVHTTGLPAGDDIADRIVASLDLSGFKAPAGG